MIIKVSELQEEGLTFQDPGQFTAPFADASWVLQAVSLHLVPDGADVVVNGEVEAAVPLVCSRCLESFPARVKTTVDLCFAPRPVGADSVELGADDLDVDFYASDQLDVSRVLETEISLALPMKPLCREDCRGLCTVCGGNRNLVTCTCPERPAEPRLAVLRDLSTRLTR
jgi:uncharacterized protein